MAAQKRNSLGMGLSAIFGEDVLNIAKGTPDSQGSSDYVTLKWSEIDPDKSQPRKVFDEEKLEELADSIREHGVFNPLIVRRNGERYTLIAGERRWRAAKLAGLKELPAIIKDYDETQTAIIALIDNMQREDLNDIEEAEGMNRLIREFGLTQDQVAQSVGKSRSAVANTVRLLTLPEEVKEHVIDGTLPAGNARLLCGMEDSEEQIALAEEMIRKRMTTRMAEQFVSNYKKRGKNPKKHAELPSYIADIASQLEDKLQTKVTLRHAPKHGTIEISYYGEDELDRIFDLLMKK